MTRRRLPTLHCLLAALVLLAPCAVPAAAAPPALIPLPAQLAPGDGKVLVDSTTVVVVADHDPATTQTAHYLIDLLARTRGLTLHLADDAPRAPAIVLQRDPQAPVAQAGGYALDVDGKGIRVRARDAAGLFHGAVTLYQLLTPDAAKGAVSVPALSIRDQPRFAWRGVMLDSVRHMQSVAEVKTLLDQMAQHKLDVLHWHLTDDQGWRIQIKRYPELTRVGAWRLAAGRGPRRRADTLRRLLHPGRDSRRGGLRRCAPHHHRAGAGHARPRAGRGGVVPATRRHRPAAAGVCRLGRQPVPV
ncbi:hypothetical protein RLIN73S_04202 [Rhodanobacter lindaniclasticus]